MVERPLRSQRVWVQGQPCHLWVSSASLPQASGPRPWGWLAEPSELICSKRLVQRQARGALQEGPAVLPGTPLKGPLLILGDLGRDPRRPWPGSAAT